MNMHFIISILMLLIVYWQDLQINKNIIQAILNEEDQLFIIK